MRRFGLLVMVLVVAAVPCLAAESAFRDIGMDEVDAAFKQATREHPRLLISNEDVQRIRKRIDSDASMKAFYKAMLAKADRIMSQPPAKRVKTGRRLLSVSRECLDRVIHLAAAYRFTGKKSYFQRCEKEMLAAARFTDWNPSHFLDVAEMTASLAIGYDWLYADLSQDSRQEIEKAILEKGIKPSLKNTSWVRGQNNWNQVCNGGITLGALAIMEDEPEMARKMVHRAINGVQVVMKHYEPDGAYPEGPGYWAYGTSYNVVLLAALESALHTDFGLSKASGFAHCATYFLHVTGPTGLYFNYPDSGSRGGFMPAVFWFARRYDQPWVAWHQYQIWADAMAHNPSELVSSRFSPLVLAWCDGRRVVPKELDWKGRGDNPVAMFHSSWTDPNAVYVAIKGGSPGVSHGHMDVGSFVIDAMGVRWAMDLGPENYNKIESLGMDLWGRSQGSQRWTIFRYNNLSHNTLVVDGKFQRVNGYAPIMELGPKKSKPFPHVVFDLSKVYEGQVDEVGRGAALEDGKEILIQDTVHALDRPTKVRWAMVTPAEVVIDGSNVAYLKKNGKVMRLTVLTHSKVQWQTYSTAPKADYDAPNPGTRQIGFEVSLSPGQYGNWAVYMVAYDAGDKPPVNPNPPSDLIWSD